MFIGCLVFFFFQNYLESVPQDLIVGHEVMRISATDIDDGNNSLVYYELEAKSQEDEGFFRIDNTSGIIFLSKNINVSRDDDVDVKKAVHFLKKIK